VAVTVGGHLASGAVMAKLPNGSLGEYRAVADLLAERFRQGKLSGMREGVSSAAVFTVGFDGPTCDAWRGDRRELIDFLARLGRCFVGVSGQRAGREDVNTPTWLPGRPSALAVLEVAGPREDHRDLDNCGEAKVLIKLLSKALIDSAVFLPERYVICSFEVHSPHKLRLKDPCEHCRKWVFGTFGEVVCHRTARPGG
jgi:hypothetical protein